MYLRPAPNGYFDPLLRGAGEKAVLVGEGGRGRPGRDVELGEDLVQVVLDGLAAGPVVNQLVDLTILSARPVVE